MHDWQRLVSVTKLHGELEAEPAILTTCRDWQGSGFGVDAKIWAKLRDGRGIWSRTLRWQIGLALPIFFFSLAGLVFFGGRAAQSVSLRPDPK